MYLTIRSLNKFLVEKAECSYP